tara:strand:- start:65 stop:667 length:603 start_codon:yes stop_codon:yes gene_type:complete
MIIIGITGSIGMGKTTVSNMLRVLRIPVFDSDIKVKEILETDNYVIEQISAIWPDVLFPNQKQKKIDKVALSDKIFKSKNERKKLEKIIHPLIRKQRNLFLENYKNFFTVGLDIPLLYETGMDKNCNYIFLVNTTKKNQKKRVLIRPNMTEKKFELINNSQWSFERKVKEKPYVINTSFGKVMTFIFVLILLFKIILKGK